MKQQFTAYARSLYAIIKHLKMGGIITALSSGAEFAQLIKPIGERPLILSGHPGDDVMALAGTMASYAKEGVPMATLTFTAGRHGTNTGKLSRSLGPKRRKEQLASYKIIGGSITPHFWDLNEKFTVDQDLVFRLIEFIDTLNPDIIYTPSLLDDHPDSQSIAEALGQALDRLPSMRVKALQVAQYELWTPIVPNKILSINDFRETKELAIKCHESQLLCRNYVEAMTGLNRYRAAMLGAGFAAEAFFICSAKQFVSFSLTSPVPVVKQIA